MLIKSTTTICARQWGWGRETLPEKSVIDICRLKVVIKFQKKKSLKDFFFYLQKVNLDVWATEVVQLPDFAIRDYAGPFSRWEYSRRL